MTNKKILIVGPFPEPTTGVSLANQVASNLLIKSGFKVTIVNTSFSELDEKLGSFSFKKFWHNLKYNTAAFKVFSNDILYITPGQTFFGVLKYALFIGFGTLSRKRIITHIHGNHLGTAYEQMSSVQQRIVHFLMSKSNTGIVLSQSLIANLTPFLQSKDIHVLPNFAEEYLQENIIKTYTAPRFIYLSNLMEEKGILIFLRALKILQDKGVLFNAQIGGGVTSEMWSQVNPLLLTLKNVDYKGVVRGKEKKELFEWGNVFVLPTYYAMEGQPISILEAMATGSLIVTTTQGGIVDVIEDGKHGFFVEKQQVEDLAAKMEYLVNNVSTIKEIGEGNVNYFNKNFTITAFSERLTNIFKS
ncbi:hypothetical protein DCS32_06000 [Dokdonia sp. Dokd-P16]|uniref:glycosyltransferase family 4 protein n=1 Tax=Dokdonia sp. Dokd-P16 TaxID=2173169 RepID=UPI000D545356|nr:glycosyltransferase family 4 protein [Dokdonia sp. Dokd-P16]AWH73725.1 hypothetical protein DCS32_06000 [Dokdonia sp. Dokd-P16]